MARTAPSPPPTLVLFVRHGQTPTTGKVLPGRAPGLHLAEKGQQQAEVVAQRIASLQSEKRKISAVYASPLERTQETAAPIARALGLRVRRSQGLLEADFGDWTGAELKHLYKLPEWRTVQRNPSGFRFPGGESFTEMQARIFDLLGIDEEEQQRKFGFFLNPFRYGAPPHGGFAFGIDRLVAILAGEENIREVIAFPKTQSGGDPMTNAPTPVAAKQLDELGIRVLPRVD